MHLCSNSRIVRSFTLGARRNLVYVCRDSIVAKIFVKKLYYYEFLVFKRMQRQDSGMRVGFERLVGITH